MEHIRYERDEAGIVTLTMDWPGESVNTMNEAYVPAMEDVLARLERERETLVGVVLASAKKTFFAGGDLKRLLALTPDDAGAVFAAVEQFKAQFRRIELLGRPVVAALAGTALGGGWELALSCHHRVAVDDQRIQFGLPEVKLGLLPGAGGITRMVRLLGLKEAFPYLMEGKLMKPSEAAALSLVELAADPVDMIAKARRWITANPRALQPWDAKGYRIPGGDPRSPAMVQMLSVAPAMAIAKTLGVYPAPEAIMAAAVEGAQVDFETATRIESRYLTQLATGQIAKNMISAFFIELNEIKAGGSRPKGMPAWQASKVGILGAGMMGAGIAYANATKGIPCVLKDISLVAAEKGKGYTKVLTDKRVARGGMTQARQQEILDRIVPTERSSDIAGCDLVVEAVFEDVALKKRVTEEVEGLMVPDGIFASNTSTLPISSLAKATQRPRNFIGLHFFSPVDKMQLVEIIRGAETSDETLARAYDYVHQLGKIPIVVNDSMGFFTSRVFGRFVSEGVGMLGEGIPAAVIENVALQAGYPVGPLAVTDELSIVFSQHIAEGFSAATVAVGGSYDDAGAMAVQKRMIEEFGRHGKAAGAGFYEYPAGAQKRLWSGLTEFGKEVSQRWDIDEIKERMLFAQAIDAIRCLQDGVLNNVRDANIGSIFGIGFPAWSGGVLRFADQYGIEAFARRAAELAAKYGKRFVPPPLLIDKVRSGRRFCD